MTKSSKPSTSPPPSQLQTIIKETTAGGVVYRHTDESRLEILLIEDAKGRWTLPKGHVETGESYRQTASREIREETGLIDVEVGPSIGQVQFQYRRGSTLVLMTLHLFVIKALGETDKMKKEDWMRSLGWVSVPTALELIDYEDICRAVLLAQRKIRQLQVH